MENELNKLKERYITKIKWLEDRIEPSNKERYEGNINGLETAVHDINDILAGLQM